MGQAKEGFVAQLQGAPGSTAPGETVATRVIGGKTSTSADLNVDSDSIATGIDGQPPVNEEGSREACEILLDRFDQNGRRCTGLRKPMDVDLLPADKRKLKCRLAAAGAKLSDEQAAEQGVDWVADCADEVMRFQVTRADQQWGALARNKHVERNLTVNDLADQLRDAIAEKEHAPKEHIILVIDVAGVADHSFEPVVSSFCQRHGAWARAVGFDEIWVVGPTASLAFRLDADDRTS